MLILDKKIPKNGLTFDNTPKVVVRLNRPLPPDHIVMVLRNGVDAGVATPTLGNDFEYLETPQLGGPADYTAEVRNLGGGAPQVSNEWPINIMQVNQAWSPTVGDPMGPYVPGASGSKEWDGNYNDSFYIGVTGVLPPDAVVTWDTEWTPGTDGWNPPTTNMLPPAYGLSWRLQVQAQSSGQNYSSGVLDITLKVNGVAMGDKLTLVLNDIPYGYEGSTWAVWTAPVGKVELLLTNVYNDGSFLGERSEIRQRIINNTDATKTFDLYGLSNVALEEADQTYTLQTFTAEVVDNGLADTAVGLYRKVNGVDTLQSTVQSSDPDFALALSEFLLDGTVPSTYRFARFSISDGGDFSLVSYVSGDYWGGGINGTWTAKVNADMEDTKTVANAQSEDTPIYRSRSTTEEHVNPLAEVQGGVWSWRDIDDDLMVFDTDKFGTPLSNANWSNAGPQFIMALDGNANPGRLKLRWTASQQVFIRLYGELVDYTGADSARANLYRFNGNQVELVQQNLKTNIGYLTQLKAGDYIEFEFYAITEDRNASRLIPLVRISNVGT